MFLQAIHSRRPALDAVVTGLTLEDNSGAVEGTLNRVKQRKMAMYGRVEPDLLRKLLLARTSR